MRPRVDLTVGEVVSPGVSNHPATAVGDFDVQIGLDARAVRQNMHRIFKELGDRETLHISDNTTSKDPGGQRHADDPLVY